MFWIWSSLLIVVLAVALFVYRCRLQTYHFATLEPGKLYRDGNRGVRELATSLRRTKARTVVPLIDDAELADLTKPEFAAEWTLLGKRGIAIERVVIPLGDWPTTDAVRRFLDIASDTARQPVLFHCAQGVRRTGMMAAAYQLSVLQWTKQQTQAAMLTFGHSRRTVGDIERFIDVYDPETRTVTVALEPSEE